MALSKETARKMFELGFPQPEFKEEQFWFSAFDGELSVACRRTDAMNKFLAPIRRIDWSHLFGAKMLVQENDIFRPNSAQILKEIKQPHTLEYIHEKGVFRITLRLKGYPEIYFYHEDADELCAKAWIDLNEHLASFLIKSAIQNEIREN